MALKGRIIKWVRYIAVAFVLVLVSLFLFRDAVLHHALNDLSDKAKKDYSVEVTVKDARFEGLFTIRLSNLVVVSSQNDTIVSFDSLEVTPSITNLVLLRLRAKSVIASNGSINLKRNLRPETSNLEPKTVDYADRLSHLLNAVFSRIPQRVELRNVQVSYQGIASSKTPRNDGYERDSVNTHLYIPYFNINKDEFDGRWDDENGHDSWIATGSFNRRHQQVDLKIVPSDNHAPVPFIDQRFHASIGFDSMLISLKVEHSGGLHLQGNVDCNNFSVYNTKLADDTVSTDHFSFSYRLNFTNHSAEVDSSSTIAINDISVHPYFQINNDNNRKEYTLNVHTNAMPATNFFNSLPKGMFNATRDIKADGELEYSLHFKLNTEETDSLEFSSEMKKDKFHIKEFGNINFTKINNEFEYTAYEHDMPFRTFTVRGEEEESEKVRKPESESDTSHSLTFSPAHFPENYYTPLNHISPYLRNAILTSEDGSFFFHNGFNEDAFRKSIAENYKKEGFARGGSTITMQLVKNVFLSRHKTVGRKAEEALITWLIESNRLCSKERMFEVYLNIIELGPGIYGVGEASRYYFNKPPALLTLSESIFIAGVLPHPKWFKYSFDEQGNLKPYLADYYRVVSNFMLKKNLITQQEYDAITPNVKLEGPAKNIVVPGDTIPIEDEDQ